MHQTHYEKSDWSRAFNQFTIASELDMINVISAADTFITQTSVLIIHDIMLNLIQSLFTISRALHLQFPFTFVIDQITLNNYHKHKYSQFLIPVLN